MSVFRAAAAARAELCRPSIWSGRYRMPPSLVRVLEEWLGSPRRPCVSLNGWRLMVFLLRHHGSPTNLGRSFPIDRRALAQVEELGLSESQVRTGLALLEKLDLIRRVAVAGSPCQRTDAGVRRKPILFRLGAVVGRVLKRLLAKRTSQKNPSSREAMSLGEGRTGSPKAPRSVTKPSRVASPAMVLDDGLGRALSRWLTGVRGKRPAGTEPITSGT